MLPPVNLLIVDDVPANLVAMEAILGSGEYSLITASSGEEALRCLAGSNDEFAAILMDVQMPGMDGFETARLIRQRERWQGTPILFLTATQPESGSVMEGYASGAVDYLIKPVSADILRAKTAVFAELHRRSVALQEANAALRAEIKAREQAEADLRQQHAQMQADLTLARDIQLALLPHHYPPFPHFVSENASALHFCHRYIPAATLGGDFFHVLAISDTLAGIFIADVMGHGVRSALVAAMMRALINESRHVAEDPARFMAESNRGLVEILGPTGETLFATAFYLVADIANGRMKFAAAGHPSPLWVRRESGVVERLQSAANGPPLGLTADANYVTEQAPLSVHDAVLFFTDGVLESENPEGEPYGHEGVMAVVQQYLHAPLPELLDAVLADVQRFRKTGPGVPFEDDVCLMAMEAESLLPKSGKS